MSGNNIAGLICLVDLMRLFTLIWLRSGWNSTLMPHSILRYKNYETFSSFSTTAIVSLLFQRIWCCSYFVRSNQRDQFVDNNVIAFGVSFSRFLNSVLWRLWIKSIFLKQITDRIHKIIWVCIICSFKAFQPFLICKFDNSSLFGRLHVGLLLL